MLEGVRNYPQSGIWWWIGLLRLPVARGRGLGRAFFQFLLEETRRKSATAIQLGVVTENKAELAFWEKLGFERVRVTEPRAFGKKMQGVIVMQYLLEYEPFNSVRQSG